MASHFYQYELMHNKRDDIIYTWLPVTMISVTDSKPYNDYALAIMV